MANTGSIQRTLQIATERRSSGGRWETCEPRSLPEDGNDPCCILSFYSDDEFVGSIALCQTKWGFWETHSELARYMQGKGYGTFMYQKAIEYAQKQGWRVASSLDYTQAAERVWRSTTLRSRFRIRKKGKRFFVVTG